MKTHQALRKVDEFYTKRPHMIVVQMFLAFGIMIGGSAADNPFVDIATQMLFAIVTAGVLMLSTELSRQAPMTRRRKLGYGLALTILFAFTTLNVPVRDYRLGPVPREAAELAKERERVRLRREWHEFLAKVRDKDVVILNDYHGKGPRVFRLRKSSYGCVTMEQGLDVLRGSKGGLDTMRLENFLASPPPTIIHEDERFYERYLVIAVTEDRSSNH